MTDAPERIWADTFFWPNVVVRGKDDCWMWTGQVMGRGYGSLRTARGSRPVGAHRFSWSIRNGRWPSDGMVIMHSCDVPSCVNPDHLSEGTQSQNIQDCVKKGRHVPFRPAKKKICKNGHKLSGDNVEYVLSRGTPTRRCIKCSRAGQVRFYEKRRKSVLEKIS